MPFRSQYDNSPYQYANCGPASIGMVLDAYGVHVPTGQLRAIANQLQGTSGYDDGVALEYLGKIARQAGLKTVGLTGANGAYRQWTMGDLIQSVRHGYPVITLVHYAALPGHAGSLSKSDHYVVVIGVTSQGFVINDPAYSGQDGYRLLLRPEQLLTAWRDAAIQNQALAFVPPSGQLALGSSSAVPAAGLGSPSGAAPDSITATPRTAASAGALVHDLVGTPVPPPPIDIAARPIIPAEASGASLKDPETSPAAPGLTTKAWAAALSGWEHTAPALVPRQARPSASATPAASTAVVLADAGSNAPSPLPAAGVLAAIGALAVSILKAPVRDQ